MMAAQIGGGGGSSGRGRIHHGIGSSKDMRAQNTVESRAKRRKLAVMTSRCSCSCIRGRGKLTRLQYLGSVAHGQAGNKGLGSSVLCIPRRHRQRRGRQSVVVVVNVIVAVVSQGVIRRVDIRGSLCHLNRKVGGVVVGVECCCGSWVMGSIHARVVVHERSSCDVIGCAFGQLLIGGSGADHSQTLPWHTAAAAGINNGSILLVVILNRCRRQNLESVVTLRVGVLSRKKSSMLAAFRGLFQQGRLLPSVREGAAGFGNGGRVEKKFREVARVVPALLAATRHGGFRL